LSTLVAACDQAELVALASSQGVAGRAADALAPLLEPVHRAKLQGHLRRHALRHIGYLRLLEKFGTALDDANVTWVVLKGPVLAELSYQGTVRGYSDLDLLVPAHQLREAVAALAEVEVTFAERNWPLLVSDATGEVLMAYRQAPLIDLHWHLVNKRSARQRFALPSDELLERRRRVALGTVDAWVLQPTDFAAHVALHAALSGAQPTDTPRLRCLLDIERTVANQAPDWELLVRRCRDWRVGLPVSVALNRAREILGAAVPEDVVWELAGSRLNRFVVRQLSNWLPAGNLPDGRSVKNGLTRSLRDNLLSTTAEFAGEVWGTLGWMVHPGPTEPTDPRHLEYDSGGAAGFDRYLEMANSADRYGHLSK
jgi:hypothetical protein